MLRYNLAMLFSTIRLRVVMLIGAVFCVLLAFDWWPVLRGPKEWQWALAPPPAFLRQLLFGGTMAFFVFGWWLIGRRLAANPTSWRTPLSLATLFALALLVQSSLLALSRDNPLSLLFERLASNQASGYFTVSQDIGDLPTFLRHYPELMPGFTPDPHPRSKPPGIVLFYWGIEQLLTPIKSVNHRLGNWARGIRCGDLWLASLPDSSLSTNLMVGILTPVISALIIIVAYYLAAGWLGPPAGWLAAGLVALLPGRLLFAPHLDTIYPLLALLAILLVETSWTRKKPLLSYCAGVILSLATFFSLVNFVVVFLVAIFLIIRGILNDGSTSSRAKITAPYAISLAAGTVTIWAVYWLTSGVSPLDIYKAAAPARHDLSRDYFTWLVGNLYDLAIFSGLPAFILAIPFGLNISKSSWRHKSWLPAIFIAFWLTLLLLDLSGMIRGETGRIWLFLAAFPAILGVLNLAAVQKPQFSGGYPFWIVLLTAVITGVMAIRLEVTEVEWPVPEPRPVTTTTPEIAAPYMANFGHVIRLLGYDLNRHDGSFDLTLYWQADSRPDLPYTVFIHVVDPEGLPVTQQDTMPLGGQLPTTCWYPGEIITDHYEMKIPDGSEGLHTVFIGLYDARDGTRLATDFPNNALPLTTLEVTPQ